jgi:NADH:ubiquinone oxidoreductase subunit F (NADH-binding)
MIEPQPRGLGDDATLAKINEIIAKHNKVEQRVDALEAKTNSNQNERLVAALKAADNAIQKAIAHFSKEVK